MVSSSAQFRKPQDADSPGTMVSNPVKMSYQRGLATLSPLDQKTDRCRQVGGWWQEKMPNFKCEGCTRACERSNNLFSEDIPVQPG